MKPNGTSSDDHLVEISDRQHFLLPTGPGIRLTCISGLIWITQQGNLRDWVLRPGESASFSGQPVLIGALRPGRLLASPGGLARMKRISAARAVIALLARRLVGRSRESTVLAVQARLQP